MINAVLFDLDGTIIDSGPGITNSVSYTLSKYGIPIPDRSVLYRFIGPPLSESFEKYFGFSHEEAIKAVDVYREYYSVKGVYENTLYDGIEELITELYRNGLRVILATSKPEIFAKKILNSFSLDKYFSTVCGSELDGRRIDKFEVIEEALRREHITDKSSVIMVGDRFHDIHGAKRASVLSVGVTYGYGSRDELEEAYNRPSS